MLAHNVDYLGKMRAKLPAQYKNKPRIDALLQAFAAEFQELEDAFWDLLEQRLLQNGPAQIVGRARFIGDDTASIIWPWAPNDTNYLMLPGKPVVLDGGGGVVVNVINSTKTKTGITLIASALFTGYVDVLMWNPGENPLARGIGDDLLDKMGKIVGQPRNGMIDTDYLILITARIAANRSDGRRETLIRIAKLLVPGATIYVKDFPPCSVYVAPQAPITINPYVAAQFMEVATAAGVYLMFGWTTADLVNTLTFGYSVANGTTVPTTAQSPGWSVTPISGGALGGVIAA